MPGDHQKGWIRKHLRLVVLVSCLLAGGAAAYSASRSALSLLQVGFLWVLVVAPIVTVSPVIRLLASTISRMRSR